ncbi:sodium/potassium-transporting ATPase subunit beta-2 [Lingula anatina]|uniref:Sodium/potassium-transporting ATPase subunit beta-2 n=1 Tax=Lingula anatina TaxID=7574 RepID=A0A1S3HMG8_LINAN|nr:sodium/potassium-transporting ATPase subunit beta-2 [Lingula anatina]|eukprot:XP_013387265.1 sodium/potassium-transporting ATPase subunit beta-2 [Lingula anatina]
MSSQPDSAELQPFRDDTDRPPETKSDEDDTAARKRQRRVVIFIIVVAAVVLVVIAVIVIGVVLGLLLNQAEASLELITRGIEDEKSTLIRYDQEQENTFKTATDLIQGVLKGYDLDELSDKAKANLVDCNDTTGAQPGKSCIFSIDKLGEKCTENRKFGYPEGAPCILLRFSAPVHWTPDPYVKTDIEYDNMVRQLNQSGLDLPLPGDIPVTCTGQYPVDQELLTSRVQYWPKRGFEGYYFPRTTEEEYMDPLLMVQFKKPTLGVVIMIECTAWAKNIFKGKNKVQFELLVD